MKLLFQKTAYSDKILDKETIKKRFSNQEKLATKYQT